MFFIPRSGINLTFIGNGLSSPYSPGLYVTQLEIAGQRPEDFVFPEVQYPVEASLIGHYFAALK